MLRECRSKLSKTTLSFYINHMLQAVGRNVSRIPCHLPHLNLEPGDPNYDIESPPPQRMPGFPRSPPDPQSFAPPSKYG